MFHSEETWKKLAFDIGYWRYMKLKTALFQKFVHHLFLVSESKPSFANIIFSAVKDFVPTTECSGATCYMKDITLNESDFELRESRWNEDATIAVVIAIWAIANLSPKKISGLKFAITTAMVASSFQMKDKLYKTICITLER